LIGILFSSVVRQDFFSTLAGVGISYILFDFLGFYGLKVYLLIHKPVVFIERKGGLSQETIQHEKPAPLKTFRDRTTMSIEQLVKPIRKVNEDIAGKLIQVANGVPVEEIEVMGGGDAVLSALIASWLGLTRLALALILGFFIGSLMGAIYLFFELYKRRMLRQVVKPMLLGALFTVMVAFMPLYLFTLAMHFDIKDAPWLQLFLLAAGSGALLGMVRGGAAVSKPFPFGPALAIGAAVAIFIDPIGQNGR
jgi:prepilin signal peptidase PulO-like enzyme (type II secretory pathway)